MADFGASYAEMEAMANKLTTAKEAIQDQLDSLKTSVDELLATTSRSSTRRAVR